MRFQQAKNFPIRNILVLLGDIIIIILKNLLFKY